MSAYYNEFEPKTAAWLRELIKAGHIAAGEVDERSILEVRPDDLREFTQCHFFAGIGVWSYALRNADWADDRPVWTGSCPCQPFSAAGKGDEFADERHLWPAWFRLIRECRPVVIFGEQVSSKDALPWIDHVRADLESQDYAFGVLDTCAAGVGAPELRQRFFFVADSEGGRCGIVWGANQPRHQRHADSGVKTGGMAHTEDPDRRAKQQSKREASGRTGFDGDCAIGRLADANDAKRRPNGAGRDDTGGENARRTQSAGHIEGCGEVRGLADPDGRNASAEGLQRSGEHGFFTEDRGDGAGGNSVPGPANGFWRDADWILCRDPDGPRWRPVEPGTFPLVDGATGRMGLLRGYGNAINAEQARCFIESYLEVRAG